MKVNKTDDVIKLVRKCGHVLIDCISESCDKGLISDMTIDLIRTVESSAKENKNLMFKDGEILCRFDDDGMLNAIHEENVVSIEFPDEQKADEFAKKLTEKKKTSAELFEELGYKPTNKGNIRFWKQEKNCDIFPHNVSYISISPEVVHKYGCMAYAEGKYTKLMDKIMSHEEIMAAAKFIEENK